MKSLALIFILLFAITNVNGQDNSGLFSVNTTMSVSTTVEQSIELITVNSLTFGSIQPGQLFVNVNPISDLNAGYMIAVGTPDAEFRLDYVEERVIERTDGPGSLKFTYSLSGSEDEEQATSILLEDNNRNNRFNDNGRYYIWVGGVLDLTEALPGNYEGDFTIEIEYI